MRPAPRNGECLPPADGAVGGPSDWAWGDDERMSVDVTVLYFAGCPSWQTMVERVHTAAKQAGVPVSVTTLAVETIEEAQRVGFAGSPTVWLEGTDPFEQPDAVPALACRVYATADGLAGSPTVGQLVDALTRRAA
jgi:hypothetical protein